MAFKDTNIRPSKGSDGERIFANGYFNLDMAVGRREVGSNFAAANLITDHQLIRYFGFIIYRDGDKSIFPTYAKDTFTTTPRQLNYTSDDTKRNTGAQIYRFQTDLLRRGKHVFRDGRCDRARGKISSVSKTAYTIAFYNFFYAVTVEDAYGRPDWQNYLLQDPLLPSEVKGELVMRG